MFIAPTTPSEISGSATGIGRDLFIYLFVQLQSLEFVATYVNVSAQMNSLVGTTRFSWAFAALNCSSFRLLLLFLKVKSSKAL